MAFFLVCHISCWLKVRLDFLDFELASPDVGDCRNESFTVRGQNVNSRIPVVCGKNTGQHSTSMCLHVHPGIEHLPGISFDLFGKKRIVDEVY